MWKHAHPFTLIETIERLAILIFKLLLACLLAQVLVEIPYVVIQAIMYSLVIYSMVGFEWTAVKFFWFLYVLFFSLISFTYYGMMMVAITPNTQLATISGAFFYSLFNLFSGFLIFRPVSSSTLAYKIITTLPKGVSIAPSGL